MTKNILIVNENIEEANAIKRGIDPASTNVICARTIGEALTAFSTMEFCLVILDAAMSGIEGDANIKDNAYIGFVLTRRSYRAYPRI